MLTIVRAVPSESIAPLTVKFMIEPASVRWPIIAAAAFVEAAAFEAPEAALATAAPVMLGIVIGGGVDTLTVELDPLDPNTPEMLL